jgi:hypothetical protein
VPPAEVNIPLAFRFALRSQGKSLSRFEFFIHRPYALQAPRSENRIG